MRAPLVLSLRRVSQDGGPLPQFGRFQMPPDVGRSGERLQVLHPCGTGIGTHLPGQVLVQFVRENVRRLERHQLLSGEDERREFVLNPLLPVVQILVEDFQDCPLPLAPLSNVYAIRAVG